MKGRWTQLAAAMTTLVLAACGQAATVGPTASAGALTATIAETAATATVIATQPSPAAVQNASQTPLVTAVPADTPAPEATVAAGLAPRQLTSGGCCVQPFWSADGSQVRYIDRPSSGQPSGIWAVNITGGAPTFVAARLGIYSPDETLVAYPEGGQTNIERVGGQRWVVHNGGRAIIFSPDSHSIAWQAASSSINFDTRQVQIWVAAVDGSGAHQAATLIGGGLAGWFPDGQKLLITNRAGDLTQIQALKLADGSLNLIAAGARIQGLVLSPKGGWVAYAVAFSGDPKQDGLFVTGTSGEAGSHLNLFGAFAWRSEGRLLVIPLEPSAAFVRVMEIHAEDGLQRALTDPAVTPFQIAGGNWALSPDGSGVAFVSAADHNIWVIDLPQ